MTHQLPELPFSQNALEPYISERTLGFHYGKHHKGYVDKLNSLIHGTSFETKSLNEIVLKSEGPIFNNAAQTWNHNFYWNSLTPKSAPPRGDLLRAIQKTFTSVSHFNEEFKKSANELFGSGWVWLVKDGADQVTIESTRNADNPILRGKIPLLVVDVWEHAYYLDYQNERARYLDSIENLLNWKFAEHEFTSSRLSMAS